MSVFEYKLTKSALRRARRYHTMRLREIEARLLRLEESPNKPKPQFQLTNGDKS